MRWSAAVVLAASSAGLCGVGCGGGVTLTVDGDRAVPAELDAICLGVADRALGGGGFGRSYRLIDRLGRLPQTLAIEPGDADAAIAWARGYRGGVVVAAARADVDFGRDVTLRLDRCPGGRGGAIVDGGEIAAPGARIVASMGQGGAVAVVIDASSARVVDVHGGALVADDLPSGGGDAIVAFDADGDCDDDLAIARGGAVAIWIRRGRGFEAGPELATAASALATADVDYDGDVDLIVAGGSAVTLWRSDGVGGFAADPGAIDTRGQVAAARAIATGDLDGDGHADLLVGQSGAPPRALLGDPSGAGVLTYAAAVFPPVALDVAAIAVADVDGDLDLDAVLAIAGGAARVYVNRGGLLEDQSFLRLPQPAPIARGAAVADWDGDCAPDAVLTGAATAAIRGGPDGVFALEQALGDATAAVATDLDDDGAPDVVVTGAAGARWFHR